MHIGYVILLLKMLFSEILRTAFDLSAFLKMQKKKISVIASQFITNISY